MPSFLHDLRRLSRSSFKSERASNSSSESGNGAETTNKSSSSVNTGNGSGNGSSTPPSTLPSQKSSSNLAESSSGPRRPSVYPAQASNRYSIAVRHIRGTHSSLADQDNYVERQRLDPQHLVLFPSTSDFLLSIRSKCTIGLG